MKVIPVSDSSTPQHVPTARVRSKTNLPDDAVRIQTSSTSEYSQLHAFLQESLNKDLVEQSNRLSETAKSLLTLQLAVPGIFAAILKMFEGSKATLVQADYFTTTLIIGAFLSWMLALGLTLSVLRPDPYRVNPLATSRKAEGKSEKEQTLGLLELYQQSAVRKFQRVTISSGLTFLGILLMVFHLVIF